MNEEVQHPEMLVGDMKFLDYLLTQQQGERELHPLQKKMEQIISEVLTDEEQDLFYMRFGEQMPFRQIAKRMGYKSHQTFQLQVQRIIDKVKEALDGQHVEGDDQGSS